MAPIKLEDNMRDRLEERTIEPTAAAWDRISSKLEAEQGVKKSKRVLWMSIAASFVGGVLIAILFFQNNTTSQGPSMVDTDTHEKIEESIFINPDEVVVPNQEIVEEKEEAIVQEEKSVKEVKESLKNEKPLIIEEEKSVERIANALPETKEVETNTREELFVEKEVVVASQEVTIKEPSEIVIDDKLNTIINQKVEEVIAQVESKESITDAEIEALLKNAQREIISNQIFNQKTNKVDANALLLDVEAEVAPASFRNKIFDAVVEGFEKTRDAVANRNN